MNSWCCVENHTNHKLENASRALLVELYLFRLSHDFLTFGVYEPKEKHHISS